MANRTRIIVLRVPVAAEERALIEKKMQQMVNLRHGNTMLVAPPQFFSGCAHGYVFCLACQHGTVGSVGFGIYVGILLYERSRKKPSATFSPATDFQLAQQVLSGAFSGYRAKRQK